MNTTESLLGTARRLMEQPNAHLLGTWPRAVALLGRQGLERAIDDFWRDNVPGVEQAPRTAQLICLGTYLEDDELARCVRHAWHALSRACHHHVYDLPPTAEEIATLLDVADRMAARVGDPGTRAVARGTATSGLSR